MSVTIQGTDQYSDFYVNFTSIAENQTGASSSTVQVGDATYTRSTATAFDNNALIAVSLPSGKSVSSIVNNTPAVCTLTGTKLALLGTGGVASVDVTVPGIGTRRVTTTLSKSGGTTTDAFQSFVATSLARHIYDGMVALIAGKTPTEGANGTLQLYSAFSSTDATLNPNMFAAALDFSAHAFYYQGFTNGQGLPSLITPWHVIQTNHMTLGPNIAFKDKNSGIVYQRTITNSTYIGNDTRIGLLNASVPITPFKILPATYATYLPSANYLNAAIPTLVKSGHTLDNSAVADDVIIGGISQLTGQGFYGGNAGVPNGMENLGKYLPAFSAWTKAHFIGGDSGSPSFFLINGVPVLLGSQSSPNTAPNYALMAADINAGIATCAGSGVGQTVGTVSLATFKSVFP